MEKRKMDYQWKILAKKNKINEWVNNKMMNDK